MPIREGQPINIRQLYDELKAQEKRRVENPGEPDSQIARVLDLAKKESAKLLVQRRKTGRWEPANRVDPEKDLAFVPTLTVEVRKDRLVGQSLPLAFQLINLEEPGVILATLLVNHNFTKGENLIHPNEGIEAGTLQSGKYGWEIFLPGMFKMDESFKVGGVQIEVEVGKDGIVTVNDQHQAEGLSLQDIIGLTDN